MSCNKCNDNPCVQPDCTCKVRIGTDCVTYTGNDLACSGIKKGTILTELIQALDTFICNKFNSVAGYFKVINIGSGAEIYAGDNNLGEKQLRTLISDTITITEDTNTISLEIPTTSDIPSLYVNNLYVPTYEEFLAGRGKGIGTLSKPFTDTVTYSSPTSYTITPGTAVQNCLDAFVGSGTRLAPELAGQRIVVQDNNLGYNFPGDFNYSNLNIKLEGSIFSTTSGYIINMDNPAYFNPTYAIVEIDIAKNKSLQIDGLGFRNSGNTVPTTTYVTGRVINIRGEGGVASLYNGVDVLNRYLFSSDPEGTENGSSGCNNDGNICIHVESKVFVAAQGVCKLGGLSKIEFENTTVYSGVLVGANVDPDLRAINQTGGLLRFFNSKIALFNGTTGFRNAGIVFEPLNGFTPTFVMRNTELEGRAETWFSKINNFHSNFDVTTCSSIYFTGNKLFDSPNLWSVNFRDNILEVVNIDFTKVDFLQGNSVSSTNTIGNNVIETLIRFESRIAAASALPPYSAFINTDGKNINDFTGSSTWFRDITLPTS